MYDYQDIAVSNEVSRSNLLLALTNIANSFDNTEIVETDDFDRTIIIRNVFYTENNNFNIQVKHNPRDARATLSMQDEKISNPPLGLLITIENYLRTVTN